MVFQIENAAQLIFEEKGHGQHGAARSQALQRCQAQCNEWLLRLLLGQLLPAAVHPSAADQQQDEIKGLETTVAKKEKQIKRDNSKIKNLNAVQRMGQALTASVDLDQKQVLNLIHSELAKLPTDRIPTNKDWSRLSRKWIKRIDERMAELQRLRDGLTECIGCGCLSFEQCRLANPEDRAGRKGSGPRYWL